MKTVQITCSNAQASKLEFWIRLMNSNRNSDDEPSVEVIEIDTERQARMLIREWVMEKQGKRCSYDR